MKKVILASGLILLSATSWAAVTSCDAIKSKIETKLEGKGVKHYALQMVAKDTETKDRVVGTCEGGSKKIIYTRAGKNEKKATE
ncbi:MAG: DUF1161 domain-containing protein [Pseudomonadota bacterium]